MEPELRSRDGSIHVTDERINTITALVGSLVVVTLAAVLIAHTIETPMRWYQYSAVGIYLAGLINLFVMSTLHHGLDLSPRGNKVLKTLDHTAIFGLIAGTMTACIAFRFHTVQGLCVLAATWLIAIISIVMRAVFELPKHISNTLFIALGWLPSLALLPGLVKLPLLEIGLLVLGGLVYSIGFYSYVAEKPNLKPGIFGFHELWHILVIIAAVLHWLFIISII